jgi:folate-binding protein YgfZ
VSPDLVRVSGPDTWTFLQSLLSQDVSDLADGERRAALMLTPQGKVEVLLGVTRSGEDALLDTDAGWGEHLLALLRRYCIRTKVDMAIDAAGVEPTPAEEAERIAGGIPRLGLDLDGSVIPQEAELEDATVSFTKGCFVGQELVCRIDSRGHVNRFLRRLVFEGAEEPARGAVILAGDREVGAVTSATPGCALGFVRREVEPGTMVTVDGAPATVHRRR